MCQKDMRYGTCAIWLLQKVIRRLTRVMESTAHTARHATLKLDFVVSSYACMHVHVMLCVILFPSMAAWHAYDIQYQTKIKED